MPKEKTWRKRVQQLIFLITTDGPEVISVRKFLNSNLRERAIHIKQEEAVYLRVSLIDTDKELSQ
jgi:hypothetical protein